jgi:hypothetical protein
LLWSRLRIEPTKKAQEHGTRLGSNVKFGTFLNGDSYGFDVKLAEFLKVIIPSAQLPHQNPHRKHKQESMFNERSEN